MLNGIFGGFSDSRTHTRISVSVSQRAARKRLGSVGTHSLNLTNAPDSFEITATDILLHKRIRKQDTLTVPIFTASLPLQDETA